MAFRISRTVYCWLNCSSIAQKSNCLVDRLARYNRNLHKSGWKFIRLIFSFIILLIPPGSRLPVCWTLAPPISRVFVARALNHYIYCISFQSLKMSKSFFKCCMFNKHSYLERNESNLDKKQLAQRPNAKNRIQL